MMSSVKRYVSKLITGLQDNRAARTVSEIKNQGWRDTEASRTKPKQAGITVRNLGTHLFSTEEVLEMVREAAEVTESRKLLP